MARNYAFLEVCQKRAALLSWFIVVAACVFLVSCTANSGYHPGIGTVATIAVTPASPSIAVNATQQFAAVAKDSSGNTVAGVTFAWASSATNVATIGSSSGLASGLTVGTTQITASASGVTSPADTLTVTAPVVATIAVTPSSPSVAVNATQQFAATAKDGGGNTITGVTFTWASSATGVATIGGGSGLATGITAGTTQITASASGVTSPADTLTVTAAVITTISVTPNSPSIVVNGIQQFEATAMDGNGNTISGVTFTWASSATGVATISTGGLATGVAAGTTQITAAAGGVTSAQDPLQVTSPATVVTGTASMGAPIAGVPVTLEDSTGASVAGTTASDGTYSLTTTGLIPPFLVQVQTGSGNLYSVSADMLNTTTINTHVLSDLIIRSWYSAQGQNIDTAFSNPVTLPAPGVTSVQIIANAVVQSTQLWLTNAGLNLSQFNLISTPYVANGTGFDSVLNDTTINTTTGIMSITNGTTTQTSTITYNTTTVAMTINSSTTTGSLTSTNSITTLIPGSSAQLTAINAINAEFAAFTKVVNTQGSQLAVANVTPFLATGLLNDGENQSQYAAVLVSNFVDELNLGGGNTISVGQVQFIKSLDLTNGVADVIFGINLLQNGASISAVPPEGEEYWFALSGGAWLIGGDNQIAKLELQVGASTTEGAQSNPNITEADADIESPQGNLTAPGTQTISGGTDNPGGIGTNIFNVATFSQGNLNSDGSFIDDEYVADSAALTNVVPAGTQFLFTITPAAGPVAEYTLLSNAFTNEYVSITSPTSPTASNYIGQTVTVTWTLPTTFAIGAIHLGVHAQDGPNGNSSTLTCESGELVATNATSGTIAVPGTLTCASGQTVTQGALVLEIFGVNGEYTASRVYFQ
jgi:hypothetical protein